MILKEAVDRYGGIEGVPGFDTLEAGANELCFDPPAEARALTQSILSLGGEEEEANSNGQGGDNVVVVVEPGGSEEENEKKSRTTKEGKRAATANKDIPKKARTGSVAKKKTNKRSAKK